MKDVTRGIVAFGAGVGGVLLGRWVARHVAFDVGVVIVAAGSMTMAWGINEIAFAELTRTTP